MNVKSSVAVLSAFLAMAGAALGEEHESSRLKGADVAPVSNDLYAKECGACHFAYPPGLLPTRSWERLTANLSDHFGGNAELAPEDLKALTDYLVNNAADKVASGRSARIAHSIQADQTPLRVTEVPYIKREHQEIPARMITGNPKVKSLSNCSACHTRAEAGSFDEHEVRVPGYGTRAD